MFSTGNSTARGNDDLKAELEDANKADEVTYMEDKEEKEGSEEASQV